MIKGRHGRTVAVAATLLLFAPAALADRAADAAKAEALLAERGAEFTAQAEIHRRTDMRVTHAMLAAPYTRKYLDKLDEYGDDAQAKRRFVRSGIREQEPFKPVYEALYEQFWPEEAKRYAREREQ